MKHLFIVNPVAGKGKTKQLLPYIEGLFNSNDDEYFIEITERPGHATELAKRYSEQGVDRIYSVGGDGTLNEVLNGIAGSSCSLGVIPGGSGNDFVRSLPYPKKMDTLLKGLINGNTRRCDLARMNGKYFLNISSVGFDSEVAYNASLYKKLPLLTGTMAYIAAIISTVFKYSGDDLTVKIDGRDISDNYLLAAVANGKCYGGGMLVAPDASIADGLFDICMVKKVGKLRILALFPLLIKGRHGEVREVSFFKGKKVEIKCSKKITINIDGEVLKANEAVFQIIPEGINLIIPKDL